METKTQVRELAQRLLEMQEEQYRMRVYVGCLEYLLAHATNNPGGLARSVREWAEDQNGRMLPMPLAERFLEAGAEELEQLARRLERAADAQARASSPATGTPSE